MIYRAAIVPPFLLDESHGIAGVGMARIFGICFALLFASSVNAVTIDLGPSDYRNWGSGAHQHRPGGIGSSFGQTVRMPPSNSVLTVTRNPVIPYGSVVNGMKNFVRITPGSIAASAAITTAFMAMDWFFDQETGEWMRDGTDVAPVDDRYIRWNWGSRPEWGVWSTPQEACEYADVRYPEGGLISCYRLSDTQWRAVYDTGTRQNQTTMYRMGSLCAPGYTYSSERGACVQTMPVPLTQSDWDALEGELVTMPPARIGSAADDIMKRNGQIPGYHDTTVTGPSSYTGPDTTSTSTDPVTGETTVTNTSTETYIEYGDTTITTTNTTTTTTYQNGQQTGETVTTETSGELPVSSGGGAAGDWPGFCEWASVVCDWFNWTQEEPPPEQDLPSVIDDDFYQEKTISFGAKSCPPDHQIDLAPFLATSVAVSFQPLCDFAGLIYYMVMAASYIIAAYITIGVARNG